MQKAQGNNYIGEKYRSCRGQIIMEKEAMCFQKEASDLSKATETT